MPEDALQNWTIVEEETLASQLSADKTPSSLPPVFFR
jgi:hypothetical protein